MSINELFNTFANNLLPILLIAAAGYILSKFLPADSRTIGRIVFYIYTRLLVCMLLLTSQITVKQPATTL